MFLIFNENRKLEKQVFIFMHMYKFTWTSTVIHFWHFYCPSFSFYRCGNQTEILNLKVTQRISFDFQFVSILKILLIFFSLNFAIFKPSLVYILRILLIHLHLFLLIFHLIWLIYHFSAFFLLFECRNCKVDLNK